MALGAAALTVCAGLLTTLAALRASLAPRWRLGAWAFAGVITASVVVPVWLRGPGEPLAAGERRGDPGPSFGGATPGGRVILLAIDGATLDYISPAAADGRLPAFGRLLDAGAVTHLATLRPTPPDPIWTTIATGKLPVHHGVRSSAMYTARRGGARFDLLPDYCFAHALVYFGVLQEMPQTSASIRARPLWSILGASAIEPAIVRWPLTSPVQPTPGWLVSDRLHLAAETELDVDESSATWPPDLLTRLPAKPAPQDVSAAAIALYGSAREPYAGAGALALDRFYAGLFESLRSASGARFLALRYQGLDVAGHYYLRQAMPRAFGEISGDERRTAGRVLDQYYRFLDAEVGRRLERLGPDDLLLVVSGFGMEPLSLPKRLIDRAFGSGGMSGTHERAPDGFLIAYGRGVRTGRLSRSSVLDVAPTILYYFGLPIGRDMDGYARTDLFTRAFTADRPITYIPTYER
jgi:hypothetical protein